MPPQAAKSTLVQRTPTPDFIPDSGGGDDFIPDAPASQPDPNEGFSQATGMGRDERGWTGRLSDRVKTWWNDPKGSASPKQFAGGLADEALMLAPAAAPERVASTGGKVALALAERTGGALAGAGAGGWAGREAGLSGDPLTAARVGGAAVGALAPNVIGKFRRGGLASRVASRAEAVPKPAPFEGATSTATPGTNPPLPPVPSGPAPKWPTIEKSGVGVPGSAAQEAGYQPPITKVPIRPEPSSPLTPEQVPGPDTAGKGNLLTPAAKRGDPRAASELQRRGRSVLHVPAEEYPGTRLQGTLEERTGQAPPQSSAPPTLAKRVGNGYKPSEKAATMADKPRDLGPEWSSQQREEMIGRYKGILRHPSATPEDIAEATSRLRELGATQ